MPGKRKDLHDSGYRCMDFIIVKDGDPICHISGCSDALHIDGISGGGKGYTFGQLKKPIDWTIDCLKTSGYLNLWCSHKLTAGLPLSSMEIFAEK